MVVSSVMVASLSFLSCSHDGRRATQDRAADTESQGIRSLGPGNVEDDIDRLERSLFQVIVPRQMTDLGHRAAPRDQENLMSLRNGVFNE